MRQNATGALQTVRAPVAGRAGVPVCFGFEDIYQRCFRGHASARRATI